MLQPLATLQRPTGSLYRLYTDARRRRARRRRAIATARIGSTSAERRSTSASRSISRSSRQCRRWRRGPRPATPGARTSAGRWDLRAAKTPAIAIGHRMLERAVVRMAAIAVIDIASGRIEALAGALSPCTRQEYDGPGRARSCDKRLPYPDPLPARCAAQPRRLSRRDAGVDDQADHGRGVPVRSGRGRALACRRAGRAAARPGRRRSTACGAS